MSIPLKYKKNIPPKVIDSIISNKYTVFDEYGEQVKVKWSVESYRYKLSHNKTFMKKWTDRKLAIAIKKGMSLPEKEMLLDIFDYTDSYNIVNFRLIANDFNYSPSKVTKVRNRLIGRGLIKKRGGLFYLNPLVWIKTSTISQELIDMFQEEMERYNVDVVL